MAWLWWLLAPVVSTALGAVAIWWRAAGETGRRFRRADPVSEHQALLRALAQQPPVLAALRASSPALATDQPATD
ncbi:hypothetical protein [Jatrophihabitans sp.]|uniref:hypothetical protein n=1 Tax=Jatrophihabitans sp. TaxID=1932789 RepID=UPI002CA9EC6A|nr:hypothetical protein [Jatrophihabitans sp.]